MSDTAEELYRRLLDRTVGEKPTNKSRHQAITEAVVAQPVEPDTSAYQKLLEDFVHSSTLDTPKLRHHAASRRA